MMGVPVLCFAIPVYNREEYLARCIESVLEANSTEIELYLVDDCSTDASAEICKAYAEKYSNIYYFTTESNTGSPAYARNFAIKNARAPFLFFLDSDDAVETKNLFRLIEILKNNPETDICCMDTIFLSDRHSYNNHHIKCEGLFNADEFLNESPGYMLANFCTRVYRKDFLIKNNLFFPKGYLSEDNAFSIRAIMACRTIYAAPMVFSLYTIASNGSRAEDNRERLEVFLNEWRMFFDLYSDLARDASCARKKMLEMSFIGKTMDLCNIISQEMLFKNVKELEDIVSPECPVNLEFYRQYGFEYSIAQYFRNLYRAAEKITDSFSKELFFFPASRISHSMADLMKKAGGHFSGFLDNNPSQINPKVELVTNMGYKVEAVERITEHINASVIICHFVPELVDILSNQLEKLGLVYHKDFITVYSLTDFNAAY